MVENQQIVLPPSSMPSQPNANEILTEDSSHHYLNDLTWKDKKDAKKWAIERDKLIMCDRHFQMVCECSGTSKSHVKKGTESKRKTKRKNTTFTKNTNCPFKLQFKHNKKNENNFWYLEKVACGRHNHLIPKTLLSHPYAARLNDEEKMIVSSMTENRMKPIDILSHIKLLNPSNVSTLATIYNAKTKLKDEQSENRNQMQQLRHLGEKYNYSVFHNEDDDRQIKNLILSHPEFIRLARCSNQVFLMDCTYKTNKYEMPVLNIVGQTSTNSPFSVAFCFLENELEESYVWALEQVKLFYVEGYTPKVIVTDKEQALLNAIARVFPDAHHLLCTFHLWNSIETKCNTIIRPTNKSEMARIKTLLVDQQEQAKEKFKKDDKLAELRWASFQDDWDAMAHSLTVEDYEERSRMLLDSLRSYPSMVNCLVDNWLDPHKENFISAFTNQYRHFDNQATSTVESSHNWLKKKLHSGDLKLFSCFITSPYYNPLNPLNHIDA
ncbi:protein FAR1-RELATED SEQUENCE 5-like [Papaver somniferum]|uniref:protein FAR1-RELATED SEQUENCE 5-like n=1 Tax=Papaver somniferum TaxID=3469 RepID=UPI000E6FC17A|nr:protein FAR1-RELATED SEQUENCE 5-like [Papaver somniferum]